MQHSTLCAHDLTRLHLRDPEISSDTLMAAQCERQEHAAITIQKFARWAKARRRRQHCEQGSRVHTVELKSPDTPKTAFPPKARADMGIAGDRGTVTPRSVHITENLSDSSALSPPAQGAAVHATTTACHAQSVLPLSPSRGQPTSRDNSVSPTSSSEAYTSSCRATSPSGRESQCDTQSKALQLHTKRQLTTQENMAITWPSNNRQDWQHTPSSGFEGGSGTGSGRRHQVASPKTQTQTVGDRLSRESQRR